MRWLYRNGNIIGVDIEGAEYNLLAICRNITLHQLYHEQLKKDQLSKQGKKDEVKDEHVS